MHSRKCWALRHNDNYLNSTGAFGEAFVNRRSTTWRGLSETERAGDPVALVSAHPTLMKRPVIEDDDGRLHLGWGKDVQNSLLG